jgi:hypothetical protein
MATRRSKTASSSRGRALAARQVLVGHVVGRDHPGAGPGLDGHVAEGHARLHVQGADRLAGVLDHVAGPAPHADLGDERQDHVLGGDPAPQGAGEVDPERLGPALEQALAGQHVLHLGGADPERERPEGAVGGGVAVAANDGHARLGEAELRPDDVDDALLVRPEIEEGDAVLARVPGELPELRRGLAVAPLVPEGDEAAAGRLGGRGVVHGRHRPIRPAHPDAARLERGERLRRGDLVHQVEVDVDDGRRPRLLDHHVPVPDAIEERARRGGGGAPHRDGCHGCASFASAPGAWGCPPTWPG